MKGKAAMMAIAVAMLWVGGNAYAAQTVVIGDLEITCPNSCVVTTVNGEVTVEDSEGAELIIRRVKPIPPPPPKQQ